MVLMGEAMFYPGESTDRGVFIISPLQAVVKIVSYSLSQMILKIAAERLGT